VRPARLLALAVALVTAAALAAGCATKPRTIPRARNGPTLTYVAIGGSDTLGRGTGDPLREAWPQVLFRSALPRDATLVNLASSSATVQEVLDRQVPQALTLHPTLVTVLITADAFTGTPTATFEARLRDAVTRLRGSGGTRVLVANIPPLDARPGYVACLPGATAPRDCALDRPVPDPATLDARVAALDAAITSVTTATGATLVDLHAAVLAERAAGREVDEYDPGAISPNAQGQRVVADAFAAAYARKP
jgi:lysophospholipase L1-like esterase